MAIVQRIDGDLAVEGLIYSRGIVPNTASPTGGITNAMVAANAGISATKVQQQRIKVESLANHGSAPAAIRKTIQRIFGATATIGSFSASVTQAITSGTVTIDLYKNGSSILTAPLTLNSSAGTGGTAGDIVDGALSSTALAEGDKLEVVVTVSSPSGGGGLDYMLRWLEDPS